MGAKIKFTDGKAVLTFAGDLTVNQAPEIRMTFIKALIDADQVLLKFKNVSDIDLTFLQLLCSAHRSAIRLNKQITFDGSRPDLLKKTVDAAGYSRATGCRLDREKTCFWTIN